MRLAERAEAWARLLPTRIGISLDSPHSDAVVVVIDGCPPRGGQRSSSGHGGERTDGHTEDGLADRREADEQRRSRQRHKERTVSYVLLSPPRLSVSSRADCTGSGRAVSQSQPTGDGPAASTESGAISPAPSTFVSCFPPFARALCLPFAVRGLAVPVASLCGVRVSSRRGRPKLASRRKERKKFN
jgi:hypothetical protein